MLKRLGLGLVKGLVVGAAIGAGLQYGLGWTDVSGLLGFLIAMATAGTTGVFAGKPPWHDGAWVEASLKGMVGVGLGALLYWAGSRWGQFQVPFPGLDGSASWTELPALFAPAISALYGTLVELDNTGDSDDEAPRRGPKARVALDDLDSEHEEVGRGRGRGKKRRKA